MAPRFDPIIVSPHAHDKQDWRSCLRRRRQAGVTAIEYALIAALIAIVILGALTLTGGNLKNLYDASTSSILKAIANALGP